MIKKILLALLFCFYCFNQVHAQYFEPQWSEFCPPKYLNVKYIEPTWWRGYVEDNNYWVTRKQEFGNNINYCRGIRNGQDQSACYEDIRKTERNKNVQYEAFYDLRLKEQEIYAQRMQNERALRLMEQQQRNLSRPQDVNVNVINK